ncbi:ribonuclease HII [Bacillus sp. CGMCC 1.16607]|uniref:ribonuclease HII n=1 Tax=Bacillus sp. CGMCC 1.16607 TaxID=3351842 RepID=UPI00363D90D4
MGNKTLREVEQILKKIDDRNHPLIKDFVNDERKGVQQLLLRWQKKIELEKKSKEKFEEMTVFENKYISSGYQWVAGVDEVGRGPLAGPVVAAAVILPKDFYLSGIDDSKKLTEKKREEYFNIIQEKAIAIGIGLIEQDVIDEINIYEATKKAMNLAVYSLSKKPEVLLIDAMKLETPYLTESIIKGDAKSISIAAASIIAKVTRDKMMKEYSMLYPMYGFEQNMGYGTKEHIDAIQKHGITPIHRKSFAPIKDYFAK